MFRKRQHHNGHMTPEASLAQAEAARRVQERKHEAEQPLKDSIDRLIEENDLARRLRTALSGPGGGRH